MVDAFYLPPLVAGSGQYFALAPHMCSLKIAPLVGGLVIMDSIWETDPGRTSSRPMMAVVDRGSARLDRETDALENEPWRSMKKNGLIIHELRPTA